MKRSALEQELKSLKLLPFQMMLETLLAREGYGDIEILDRRESKQKSRYGGFEMRCRLKLGSTYGTVLVKVVTEHAARTRHIHEMAGCVLQHDAYLGLVISPGNTKPNRALVQALQPKMRVRLIEGKELAEMLTCSGVGVRPKGDVDYRYFATLDAAALKVGEAYDFLKTAV